MGVAQNGCFVRENPIYKWMMTGVLDGLFPGKSPSKMDDWGVNPIYKWMMTGGTPISEKTSIHPLVPSKTRLAVFLAGLGDGFVQLLPIPKWKS